MSLKDIKLKVSYNSGEDDIVNEFYIPCFKNSLIYDRAVGFFTSNILNLISKGLNEFIKNNGKMRLICSPQLTEEDIDAIEKGYKKRDIIINATLIREIDKLSYQNTGNSLNYLSWLIAKNRLDIKIALPKDINKGTYGIYHEKIGIFKDSEDNTIAFYGSNNETLFGVSYNYESFDIYTSWEEPDRYNLKQEHFNKLWNNIAAGLEIYEFPVAVKNRLIEKIPPQKILNITENTSVYQVARKTSCEEFIFKLWDFQKKAIENWRDNSFQGILSMATGTGKTKTAIGGIIELSKGLSKLFVVVSCPQNTIIKQWENEISNIDLFEKSIVADSTNNQWERELADLVIEYNNGYFKKCIIFTTYNTLSSSKFINIVLKIVENSLLISDEVHWSGAETFSKGLVDVYKFRLGLSATPDRYFDDEGSEDIINYFGKTVYEFSLEKALKEINPSTGKTFLCQYDYYPIFVPMNDDEFSEYRSLTKKISRQHAREVKRTEKSSFYQRLCEERQRIIVNAESKYIALENTLNNFSDIKYLLVYCSPEQIDKAQAILNGKDIKNHRFTGRESNLIKDEFGGISERDYILDCFEKKDYSALIAMKCLDEGVNILRAETAIIMASSGNPKQYIQRRGRLLRRHPEKIKSKIYDIIVIPYLNKASNAENISLERKILENEFKRYDEFAKLAYNNLYAQNEIIKVKKMFNLI